MNNYAPVLIITLNRYEHFRRCVESLSACIHADKTDLYIAFDYPLNDSHWEGYRKIEEFLAKIEGFKTVNIIKRNENYGMLRNFFDGNQTVFEKYDRIIFSEDDNEFSPNFLDYINNGLEKFKHDDKVFAICGYNFPIEMPKEYKYNFYYYKGFCAWGYGIWKKNFENFFYSSDEIIKLAKNKIFLRELYKNSPTHLLALIDAVRKHSDKYGDGAVSLNLVNKDKYCVIPYLSKVRNYGHDGSGLHCGTVKDNIFIKQLIDEDMEFSYSKSVPKFDRKLQARLRKYFELTLKGNLKLLIKYVFFRLEYF